MAASFLALRGLILATRQTSTTFDPGRVLRSAVRVAFTHFSNIPMRRRSNLQLYSDTSESLIRHLLINRHMKESCRRFEASKARQHLHLLHSENKDEERKFDIATPDNSTAKACTTRLSFLSCQKSHSDDPPSSAREGQSKALFSCMLRCSL